ncbi:hypothetical protein MPTK1_6g06970 [Marchantia polymorpha subsp. ruderalis]|uniref:Uncharacterized protein n=2 Tax=Marchantia polymorpha TaxID=3197 RepID=A0AAF6BPB9_MARPO|nr:hypothetical protein MARPO_0053s0012 [Marchantia polymorpha]BBN13853.1 hypothetical protein Mp_6g06970 [Marchantia polymorpha subsp. ruderalis]|eukprot:PTQ38055.1 hypothetical protein MARPO_0053s0012 [Marchantia polymorpha]
MVPFFGVHLLGNCESYALVIVLCSNPGVGWRAIGTPVVAEAFSFLVPVAVVLLGVRSLFLVVETELSWAGTRSGHVHIPASNLFESRVVRRSFRPDIGQCTVGCGVGFNYICGIIRVLGPCKPSCIATRLRRKLRGSNGSNVQST